MLGTISGLVAVRIGLAAVGGAIATYLVEDLKKVEEEAVEVEGTLNSWETLFHQMGIIKWDKGDRVKLMKKHEKECYDLFEFEVSTSVSVAMIEKHLDSLRIKLKAPRLEVEGEGNKLYLKNLKTNVSPKYFKIEDAPNYLYNVGTDDENELIKWNLRKDPSLVLGGSTGCGKSALMNMLIMQILAADHTELFLVDMKAGVEFGVYEGLEKVRRYAEDEKTMKNVIRSLKMEMPKRMKELGKLGYKNYEQYMDNETNIEMNRLFLVIDEAADVVCGDNLSINKNLFKSKAEKLEIDVIEDLREISRKGRAAGIHIIMATQRHTADSIDPTTKGNCTAILGMRTMNAHNSELIINRKGLERLEQREGIAILEGKETHFRTLFLDEKYLREFVNNQPKGVWYNDTTTGSTNA